MNIICENPYRIIGVYSNSTTKEQVANRSRLKASLRVGKAVQFPLDLSYLLPPITRTKEQVEQAEARIALPKDQVRYAQFWFINTTTIDDIACGKLVRGDVEGAIEIWKKKDSASSFQNRIVCALILKRYGEAIDCAERLYSNYVEDFVKIVLGSNATAIPKNLAHDFLDILCEEIEAKASIFSYIGNDKWKQYVRGKSTQPIIDAIFAAIATAKTARGKGSVARYEAGLKLINDTKALLSRLGQFLLTSDLQYQMVADKLGLEILQCGIDCYNDSEEPDAARKALRLQEYAQTVVVGKMAKDRCKENANVLNKIIAHLPPVEVATEDRAIKEELRKTRLWPKKICHAVTLLNSVMPYLQSIRRKLGAANNYYKELSTTVVACALNNVIEEVNKAQDDDKSDFYGMQLMSASERMAHAKSILHKLQGVLSSAWSAIKIMDTFDMDQEFRERRYNPNRATLKRLYDQWGRFSASVSRQTNNTTGCLVWWIVGIGIMIFAAIAKNS